MGTVVREVLMVLFIAIMAIYVVALRNNNVLLMEQIQNVEKLNAEQSEYIEELQANDSKKLALTHIMEQGASKKQAIAIIESSNKYGVSAKF